MKPRAPLILTAVAFAAGCYRYVPVDSGTVSPGDDVRARLTAGAGAQLDTSMQRDGVLEGTLVERDDGAFTLSVPSAVRREGFFAEDLHERVRLDMSDVIEIERRELDRARTYVLSAAGAAAVVAIAISTLSGKTGGNTVGRNRDGPSAIMVRIRE